MIGSVLKYLTEVNLKDHWTWCTDVSYLFGLKCERQHYISVLSGYIQPLTLLSHESRKWMQNLGCYSSVIQGSLPGRIGKFAMAVMPLPNYSLKICNILQLDCLRVHVYNPGLIHTLFVNILVLHCLSFCFPFLRGKFISVAFLLCIVCSRHKSFRSCLNRTLN